MKNTDRLSEIEQNIGDIAPENVELTELYGKWQQALDEGDTKAAHRLREAADKWLKADSRFTELAYFPPEGSGIDLTNWHKFAKFNFGNLN